jgi:hypothetical protein
MAPPGAMKTSFSLSSPVAVLLTIGYAMEHGSSRADGGILDEGPRGTSLSAPAGGVPGIHPEHCV